MSDLQRPVDVPPAFVARKVDRARQLLGYMAVSMSWTPRAAFRARIADAGATELRRIAEENLPHVAARMALDALDEAGL